MTDHMNDLRFVSEPEVQNRDSLLSKYNIPINYLDFSYVETCKNVKELGKILDILRSGEEGYYPDLVKFTEERLETLDPKNKLLRKTCPIKNKTDMNKDELNEIEDDLNDWLKNVRHNDKELENTRVKDPYNCSEFPKIREKISDFQEQEKKNDPKRISSTDYESWSKYDPDTELIKMEIEEEKERKAALALEEERKKSQGSKQKKSVSFNRFATEAEAVFEANREKEKGNECFKSGEYAEAFEHYSMSIRYKPSLANYNNRAIAGIKLKRFQQALDDCHRALAIEPEDVKALTRKALALEAMQMYGEALKCIEKVIQLEPNNSKAQDMAHKCRNLSGTELVHKRMIIRDD